jgi:ubiquinone/menaquinone biosynthesis C-methylase UbiE
MPLPEHYLHMKLSEYYRDFSNSYDNNMTGFLWPNSNQDLISRLNISKEERVLDMGTGTGMNITFLPNSNNIYACDGSARILELAKLRAEILSRRIHWNAKVDLRNLPYKDEYFDKVILTYVLSGTANPIKVLSEAIRVTREGGLIGIHDFASSQYKLYTGFGNMNLHETYFCAASSLDVEYQKTFITSKPEQTLILRK